MLIVGSGAFLGGVARYKLGALVFELSKTTKFPYATLSVNLLGCFLIGAFLAVSVRTQQLGQLSRLFFVTGILGGFTTFSAFGLETVNLFEEKAYALALLYVLSSVIGGVLATLLAFRGLKYLI